MTLTFLNCKNVTTQRVEPPAPLNRKAIKETGRPLVRYHVLDVRPMRKVLETEGEVASKGPRHALHICRGHFKTFTDEAPLFGRYTGTYYWEEHVRGTPVKGVVVKDYNVQQPE
jgi:hypothetical protein